MTSPQAHGERGVHLQGSSHGGGVRGASLSRRSPQFEGRFGRIFRTLPPAEFSTADLTRLALAMTAAPEADQVDGAYQRDELGFILAKATPEDEVDGEENFGLPAGYTYLGQFIDHDLTFDPQSSLQRQNDPDGLTDYRTPRFDLDCVYGRGPDDQPYMFDPTGRLFHLSDDEITENGKHVGVFDLPRFRGRALIGDKRNDENVIVSQIQSLFMRFHNVVARANPDWSFQEVQSTVRWHYQWIVLQDFLPRIVGREMVHSILPHLKSGKSIYDDRPHLKFYHFKDEAFIPIEFSVAAYRFGHSMVRPIYRLNTELGNDATPMDIELGRAGRQFIFAGVADRSLAGFGPFPNIWAIDWSLFFEVNATLSPDNTVLTGARRVQPAYKIDTSLVNPLGFLPEFSRKTPDGRGLVPDAEGNPAPLADQTGPAVANLALRNLMRSTTMRLPSGQDVARFMGLTPLKDAQIRIGKAQMPDANDPEATPSITEFGDSFVGQAPLWTYILAEAQADWLQRALIAPSTEAANALPVRLGPVGGRIVAEVFVGLLLGDSFSFLSQYPGWTPTFADKTTKRFGMPELIRLVTASPAP